MNAAARNAMRRAQHLVLGRAIAEHCVLSAACYVTAMLVHPVLGTACYVLGIPHVVLRYWRRSETVSRGTAR